MSILIVLILTHLLSMIIVKRRNWLFNCFML
jgi:hypothetical protein